jgi:N-acyl-D-amino-acid deacylase
LYFLRKAGVAADHPALARGKDWLVRSQLPDGSWRTESHVKVKVQPWYDNGDPHGEHQYLSTAATAWATAGLAALLPDHTSMSLPKQR